jgi:hypothetical protein
MKRSAETTLFFIIALALILVQVSAVPPMPMEFFGSVTLDGNPAPAGAIISAQVNGVERGNLTTTVAGFYGGPAIFDNRLKVFISENEYQPGNNNITFFINGWQSGQSVEYVPGKSVQMDLVSGGTGTAKLQQSSTPIPLPVQTPSGVKNGSTGNESGSTRITTGSYPPEQAAGRAEELAGSEQGKNTITYGLDQKRVFTSEDGLVEVLFEKDTMLFSPDGQFLTVIGIKPKTITDLPPLPQNKSVQYSGYAYEIIPEATYFNPKGLLTLRLPPERAYEIIRSGPVILEYLPQSGSWERINTDANMFANTISADIYEAAIYGLFIPVSNMSVVNNSGSATIPVIPFAGQNMNQSVQSPSLPASAYSGQNSPVITPQAIITPSEVITPLPVQTEQSPVFTPEPGMNGGPVVRSNQTLPPAVNNFFDFPVISRISTVLSAIKSMFTGPVVGLLVLLILIAGANVAAFATYKYWWQKRDKPD